MACFCLFCLQAFEGSPQMEPKGTRMHQGALGQAGVSQSSPEAVQGAWSRSARQAVPSVTAQEGLRVLRSWLRLALPQPPKVAKPN